MAVPKKKMSRRRTRQRKAAWKVSRPTMSTCPQCRAKKLPHRACPNCGHYNGREVLEVD
ncbi:MAG TPA: 50S ribosomal protein L32 [Acidimicrobiia bacterium]|jgi:large subunit ribosomal protein L32|nr:50S ribosomal protein L32 [Acidimicrobiia bacterium]